MSQLTYRFEIDPSVDLADAQMSLHLAMIAMEGLFGTAGVQLDARHWVDEPGRALLIDGSTKVGQALARVLATLLSREFGEELIVVRRIGAGESAEPGDLSLALEGVRTGGAAA
jgi:hypothetical protein